MMRRSFIQAIRPAASVHNLSAARSLRQFSSTPSYGLKSIFTETENDKLNKVLQEIQNKITLPAHLPEKQRQLIFDAKKKAFIEQNPIIIEVDGLEHRFSHINRFKDIPNSKKTYNHAISLMETGEDFNNIGTLLAGYKKAGIIMFPFYYSKAIRKAQAVNQMNAIIECAKQADKTGLALTQDPYIIMILSHNNKRDPASAVKLNDVVLDLLQRPPHQKKETNPLVTGQVLYAQARNLQARIEKGEETEKEAAAVQYTAEHLEKWWAHYFKESFDLPKSITSTPKESTRQVRKTEATLSGRELITAVAQNLKAMALARELVGEEVQGFTQVEDKLNEFLREVVECSGEKYRAVWPSIYEEIVGVNPGWVVPEDAIPGH